MTQWFRIARIGDTSTIQCSAHFVRARFNDADVPATDRDELERRAALGQKPSLCFMVPPADVGDVRPPKEDLFAVTTLSAYIDMVRERSQVSATRKLYNIDNVKCSYSSLNDEVQPDVGGHVSVSITSPGVRRSE